MSKRHRIEIPKGTQLSRTEVAMLVGAGRIVGISVSGLVSLPYGSHPYDLRWDDGYLTFWDKDEPHTDVDMISYIEVEDEEGS